jgi:hypothetical protein
MYILPWGYDIGSKTFQGGRNFKFDLENILTLLIFSWRGFC